MKIEGPLSMLPRKSLSISAAAACGLFTALSPDSSLAAQSPDVPDLGFEVGWEERWRDFDLGRPKTEYRVVLEGDTHVLAAASDRSASAMLHRLRLPTSNAGRISWSWKVESAIPGNNREREKKGDDYAARLFVIFDDDPFTGGSRALCYVWAASEAVGERYPNPYHKKGVAIIVIDSGDDRAGEWIARSRDFVADYREAFGMAPRYVSAVALMVDTDDTKSRARAWFRGLSIEVAQD